jgi:hypothetical protein
MESMRERERREIQTKVMPLGSGIRCTFYFVLCSVYHMMVFRDDVRFRKMIPRCVRINLGLLPSSFSL